MRHTQHNNTSGFTLVEMLVSLAVFTVVMVIGVGALLSIVASNRKAQSIKSVMNNVQFAVDSMARTMRTGNTYHCGAAPYTTPSDCAVAGDTTVAFEPYGGSSGNANDQVVYRLNNGKIERSTDGGNSFLGVTAPEVVIDNLTFYVDGSVVGDNKQPQALIVVKGHTTGQASTVTTFSLQTLVSQRLLDQ